MERRPTEFLAHLALFAVAIFYGINFFVIKPVFESQISNFAVLAIRSICTAAFFWIYHAIAVRERIRERKDYIRLFLAAIFGVSINQLFYLWGLALTSRVNGAVLMILTPVFVFLAAWVLREERFSLRSILGLALSFTGAIGLILVGSSQKLQIGGATVAGDVMIMVNAAAYGIYLVFVRPLIGKYHTFTIIKWLYILGALPHLIVGIGPLMGTPQGLVTWDMALRIGYLIVFATIIAYWLNAWAMKRLPPSAVGIYIYVQPVFVTLCSAALGMKEVSWVTVPLIGLIFIGVWLVTRRRDAKAAR